MLLLLCTNKEQESWWTSRINVVQAHALYQQDKTQQALDLLRKSLKSLESMTPSPTMDHAVAYTMLHLYELESSNEGGGESRSKNGRHAVTTSNIHSIHQRRHVDARDLVSRTWSSRTSNRVASKPRGWNGGILHVDWKL